MDELRGRARRPRAEIVPLDERDAQAVPSGELGHADTDDSSTDNEEVEPLFPQALEGNLAQCAQYRRRLSSGP